MFLRIKLNDIIEHRMLYTSDSDAAVDCVPLYRLKISQGTILSYVSCYYYMILEVVTEAGGKSNFFRSLSLLLIILI